MKILVACEFSGMVRRAFREAGHDAWSCDILPAEDGDRHHIMDDCLNHIYDAWDMMIAHPPCTFLTCAGARWFGDPRYPNRYEDQAKAIEFFMAIKNSPIKKKCIENPRPLKALTIRAGRYTQLIQPWQFGDKETKGVCLWLEGLPPLIPTHNLLAETMALPARERHRVWYMPPGTERQKERSRFFLGITRAMTQQWGDAC